VTAVTFAKIYVAATEVVTVVTAKDLRCADTQAWVEGLWKTIESFSSYVVNCRS
jgi:hypothetical protein